MESKSEEVIEYKPLFSYLLEDFSPDGFIDRDYFKSIDNLKTLNIFINYCDSVKIKAGDWIRNKINLYMDNIEIKWYPGEMFFSGGGLSLILNPYINEKSMFFKDSDIDLYITGDFERKKTIFNEFIDDLSSKYEIENIEFAGSVVNIKIVGKKRILQIIIVENNKNMDEVLECFDCHSVRSYFDGEKITLECCAYNTFKNGICIYTEIYKHKFNYKRIYKMLLRGEEVHSMTGKEDIIRGFVLGKEKINKKWIKSSIDEVKSKLNFEGFLFRNPSAY